MTFTPGATYSIAYRLLRRFGWQNLLVNNFNRGFIRDLPRSVIPQGGVYDLEDLLVDSPGIAYKRGCVISQSALGTSFAPNGVAVAPFDSTHVKVVGVGYDGANMKVLDCTTGTASAITGTANTITDPPRFLVDKLILLDFGAAAPQKVTLSGSTLVLDTLGGSPPQGRVGCVHLSRFLIANTAANPNRIYFGPVPDVESTWDTTNAWIDVDEPVTAMSSVAGSLMVWSKNRLWRIIGTLPPGDPNENMQLQPVADMGTFDGRSVAVGGALAYFANDSGVYETNGAGVTSLTEKKDSTGISTYWRQLSTTFSSGAVFAVGLYKQRYLLVSYSDASFAHVALACYLPNVAWTRFSAGFAHMYASLDEFNTPEQMLGASAMTDRIIDVSAMFEAPATFTVNDVDTGTAPRPQLITGGLGLAYDLKAFAHAHLTYDMRDNVSPTNPTLQVQAASGLQATTFADLPESPLPETTDMVRRRLSVNRDAECVSLNIRQSAAASASFEIHAVEVESRAYGELAEVP